MRVVESSSCRIFICLTLAVLAFPLSALGGPATERPAAIIRNIPLQTPSIDPRLFGNFIELLDDVVPGMWAEMLGDRSFEGILPPSKWCYYDGAPDLCDRTWETNGTWSLDITNAFNGARCARLSPRRGNPASLVQSGLAVKKGMGYSFSGWFRADAGKAKLSLTLKALLPDGRWMTLASARLPEVSGGWKKYSVKMKSIGTTDRAVFELQAAGEGGVWVDKLSLMPDDNLKGWRRDVIETVKDVHPAIVRWGGSAADPGEYRWKNGISDRDARVPFKNKVWGRIDPNDVGIDEFCQFCELTGVEPLICLSFSDGAGSAAELVEYCNGSAATGWGARRAANGHPQLYSVKYWQVGNEISGDNANYLAQFGDFAKQMKERDATVQIMTSFPTQQLLNRYGAEISFICPHHYTTDLGGCDRDFANLTRMIETTPGCGGIQIAVTEWNISGGDWGLGRARELTLMTALQNARYLHVMMRHSGKVKIGCRSNMANSYCGAIFETSPDGVLKRPSYYVMQLYARHAKPVPVEIKAPGDGLDVVACRSQDEKSLVIFAVNYKGESVPWRFQFDGFAGTIHATNAESLCDRLGMGQPDIVNQWNAPDRVSIQSLKIFPNSVVLPPLSATAIECSMQ